MAQTRHRPAGKRSPADLQLPAGQIILRRIIFFSLVVKPIETTIFIFSKNPPKSTQFTQNDKLHQLKQTKRLQAISVLYLYIYYTIHYKCNILYNTFYYILTYILYYAINNVSNTFYNISYTLYKFC